MKGYIDEQDAALARLEQRLREDLRQEAQSVQLEAQVFWARVAHKLSAGRRTKEHSKHI